MPFTSADGMLSCRREIPVPSYIYLRSLLSDGFVVLELQIWPHINIRRFVLPFFKYNLERFPLPHSPLKFGNRAQGCRQFGRQPSHDLENWAGARDDTNERGSLTGGSCLVADIRQRRC
jgi:hypothetical protein